MKWDNFENQLDAIRIAIYEQERHKDNKTNAEEMNVKGKKIAQMHGIKVIKSLPKADAARSNL